MNGTETIDPAVELAAVRRELAAVKSQLACAHAERERERLTANIARQLAEKLEPVAAFDAAAALAARVSRSATGRLVVEADGILADDAANWCGSTCKARESTCSKAARRGTGRMKQLPAARSCSIKLESETRLMRGSGSLRTPRGSRLPGRSTWRK